MDRATSTTGLAKFAADTLAWAEFTYPERRVIGFALILDNGQELRLPASASAFTAHSPAAPTEASEVDDAILGYLREQRGARLTATQIRDGMEKDEKIVFGQSTVERSLAKMRGDGRVVHRTGQGYSLPPP